MLKTIARRRKYATQWLRKIKRWMRPNGTKEEREVRALSKVAVRALLAGQKDSLLGAVTWMMILASRSGHHCDMIDAGLDILGKSNHSLFGGER